MRSDLYETVLDEAEQVLEAGNHHDLSACNLYNAIASAIGQYTFTEAKDMAPTLKFAIAKGIKNWCEIL